MSIAFNRSILVWMVASALPSAAQNSPGRLATARQLLSHYTNRVRWQHYWLPGTVDKRYVPGSEVPVKALFSSTAAGFCASALEICQIYERTDNGTFEFLTEWEPEKDRPPAGRPKEQRAFEATKFAAHAIAAES